MRSLRSPRVYAWGEVTGVMMGEAPKESYVTKLLTLLVSRAEGKTIKIPASELFSQDIGQGITVYWDEQDKALVLTHLPSGAKSYVIKENLTWINPSQLSERPKEPQPLSREDLLAKVWTESAASPTNQELREKKKPTVIHLTDENLALKEASLRKAELLRELENYQSPQPAVVPSGAQRTFYKQ